MKFHYKIMLAAVTLSIAMAGGAAISADDRVFDQGWWVSVGLSLIGKEDNGLCSCL